MRFRNSIRLLLNNFKSTYVLLLFRLLISLIVGSLVAVIVMSGVGIVGGSAEWEALLDAIKELPATFFNSASYEDFDALFREELDGILAAFGDLLLFVRAHVAELIFSALGLVLLYLVGRFLNGLALFAFGNILNDKMSECTDTPFFVGFLHNVGSAALYQVVYVPLAFAFDALTVALCYLIFFKLFFFLPVLFSLFLATTFIIAMQAVKLSWISDWMPAIIVDGKKLSQAIKESFHMGRKRFGINFSNYLMAIYCILAFNVVFALSSFFSGLLVTVPASFAFLICMQFTNYYVTGNRKFFLSYTHICDPATPDNSLSFRLEETIPFDGSDGNEEK